MPILDLLLKSPIDALALLLYIAVIGAAVRLLAHRHYGPDRLLLALVGIVSTYQGARLLEESGIWNSSLDARSHSLVRVTIAGMYLTALWVIARWSRECRLTEGKLRIVEVNAETSPAASIEGGPVSPELLYSVLRALPLSVQVEDRRGRVILSHMPAETQADAPRWSVPIGHEAMGLVLKVHGICAPPTARLESPAVEVVADPTRDRRRQLRVTMREPIGMKLQLLDSGREIEGQLHNFSGGGLGVEVAEPISLGQVVLICLDDALVLGEVCHCRPVEGESKKFRIGLKAGQFLVTNPASNAERAASAAFPGYLAALSSSSRVSVS